MNGRHVFGWAAAALLMLAVSGCGKNDDAETSASTSDSTESPAAQGGEDSAGTATATSVEWADAKGDVEQLGPYPTPDVTLVSAVGRDGHLEVTVALVGGPGKTLDHEIDGKRSGDTVLELWVDADNDPATGSGPMRTDNATRKIAGYDASINLMLGFDVRVKESGMETDMHGNVMIDTAELEILGQSADIMYYWRGGDASAPDFDRFREAPYCSLTKTGITMRLPYDMFGVKPGDTIRLCFNEDNQDSFGAAGFSEDRLLTLQ